MNIEKDNFLTKSQKNIKQQIMESLMDSFDCLHNAALMKKTNIDAPLAANIVLSCLIMFAREMIIMLIKFLPASEGTEDFTNDVLQTIKKEVEERLNIE